MKDEIGEKTFEFRIRDRLTKECQDAGLTLNRLSTRHAVMIDMMAYCAHGDEEEAVRNLEASKTFLNHYEVVSQGLGPPAERRKAIQLGKDLLFEFWRKCFIKKKFSVQAEIDVPERPPHEILEQDYGHLVAPPPHSLAFLKSNTQMYIEVLKIHCEEFNKIYVRLVKPAGGN